MLKQTARHPDREWIIYTRVSTEEQADSGASLAAQENNCKAAAQLSPDIGDNIRVISDPGFSAKDLRRPGMQEILERMNNGLVGGVIVWRLDRLSRKMHDLLHLTQLFDEQGIELKSVTENIDTTNPIGRLMLNILGSMAQWERETISERIRAAKKQLRLEGKWSGGPCPPGCKIVGDRGNKYLLRDETTGPIVGQAWAMIASGKSLRDIIAHMHKHRIKTALGNSQWSTHTVHSLINQERLVGVLVSQEDYDAAHEALGQRQCPTRRKGSQQTQGRAQSQRTWVLNGVARCSYCGATFLGTTATGKSGSKHHYLRCCNKGKATCSAPELPAETWEQAVIATLIRVVDHDGPFARQLVLVAERLRQQKEEHTVQIQRLTTERDAVNAKIKNLIALVEGGSNPAAQVMERIQELNQSAKEIQTTIDEFQTMVDAAQVDTSGVDQLVAQLRNAMHNFDLMPAELQRRVFDTLVREVRIGYGYPIQLSLWWPDPSAYQNIPQLNADQQLADCPDDELLNVGEERNNEFMWRSRLQELLKSESVSLNFEQAVISYRNDQGGRDIKLLTETQPRPEIEAWLNTARTYTAKDLAAHIGCSDRHARRIHKRKITDEGLASLAEKHPFD